MLKIQMSPKSKNILDGKIPEELRERALGRRIDPCNFKTI